MCSASIRSAERGAKVGNLAVLGAYAIAVVYDLLENPGVIRLFTPFRYFPNQQLMAGHVPLLFVGLCVALCVVFFTIAFARFERRDLGAL
jgi:ABC-type transport system involved in multi-copper enzyme maturation permease subunit